MILAALTPRYFFPDLVDGELANAILPGDQRCTSLTSQRANLARFAKSQLCSAPSPRVHGWRDWLKMVWSDAARFTAEVVKVKAIRDRPDLLLVHCAVREDLLSADPHVIVLPGFPFSSRVAEDPARRCESGVADKVIALRKSGTRACVAVAQRVYGWLATPADAKRRYGFHLVASLHEVTRGANGAYLRVAPFYIPAFLGGGSA